VKKMINKKLAIGIMGYLASESVLPAMVAFGKEANGIHADSRTDFNFGSCGMNIGAAIISVFCAAKGLEEIDKESLREYLNDHYSNKKNKDVSGGFTMDENPPKPALGGCLGAALGTVIGVLGAIPLAYISHNSGALAGRLYYNGKHIYNTLDKTLTHVQQSFELGYNAAAASLPSQIPTLEAYAKLGLDLESTAKLAAMGLMNNPQKLDFLANSLYQFTAAAAPYSAQVQLAVMPLAERIQHLV
jgi:hypothetical protein